MTKYTKKEIKFFVDRIKSINTSGKVNICANCSKVNTCKLMWSFFVAEFISKYKYEHKLTTRRDIITLIERVFDTGCSSLDEVFENTKKCNKLSFSYLLNYIDEVKQDILSGKFDFNEKNVEQLFNILNTYDKMLTIVNSENVSGVKTSGIVLNFRM